MALTLAVGCKPGADAPATPSKPPASTPRIGFVLHGLNPFTHIIEQGAKDAAAANGLVVDVVGPAGFSATGDAIALFEGMVAKRVAGLVVIPMPGEVWVTPIRQATEAGIPVLTANVMSRESAARGWFGQDEFNSGALLATRLRKLLAEQNTAEGRIVVGMCAPGVGVLVDRYEGFKKGFEGSRFQITQPFDVSTENTANYAAWESLTGANPGMIAAVGLCSMDLANLAKLKQRSRGRWLVAGYDLDRETLDAIRDGTVQIALGQHPYLQGYLPVLAFARQLREKQPLPQGWIDVGTEIITKQNLDSIEGRDVDPAKQKEWYAADIARRFQQMNTMAKRIPDARR
ncbi:MAG: substrate-binding domain-containing protein [Verrucomicrobia bacterium]|nr:substrate-binding domain-containing protein [Verrucomicrobiota bacterium]